MQRFTIDSSTLKICYVVRFHVLTAVLLEMQVLRNVTPCLSDVSKDLSALTSLATLPLAKSEDKTPHTLKPSVCNIWYFTKIRSVSGVRSSERWHSVVFVRVIPIFRWIVVTSKITEYELLYRHCNRPIRQKVTHQKTTPLAEQQISRYLVICPRMK